jgi:hypothetical protein
MTERRALVNISGVISELPQGDTLAGQDVAASQAEMEAGTEAALRSMSPLLVRQALNFLLLRQAIYSQQHDTDIGELTTWANSGYQTLLGP